MNITVNPDKLQAMVMTWDKKENKYNLIINNSIVSSLDFVTQQKCSKSNSEWNW